MDLAFPTATSPSFISTPQLLYREVAFCGVCRALCHHAASPPAAPAALLLLPLALRPHLEAALAVLVDLLDGVHPAPAATAGERASLAALPRAPTVADLTRIAVKYLAPTRKCGGGSASSASRALLHPAPDGGAPAPTPDLLTYASALHGLEAGQRPGWLGLLAPELLVGTGPPEGATPPRPDALALNTALALLCGAPCRPALHVHFLAPRSECGEGVARVLQRAAVPLRCPSPPTCPGGGSVGAAGGQG
jgi:hypothetical protein